MKDHPDIVFRSGSAGRRAALATGPDAGEIMRVVRNVEGSGETAVTSAADWHGLAREQVDTAVRYCSEYPDEVDRWIDHVDEEARRAEQIWERRQRPGVRLSPRTPRGARQPQTSGRVVRTLDIAWPHNPLTPLSTAGIEWLPEA